MQDYRITIRLLSPVGTPWQSDTVFGHLAWHVARGALDISIEDFLGPFRNGKPPFVLSDGFPEALLPRPFTPVPASQAQTTAEYSDARARRKARYVSVSDFEDIRSSLDVTWEPQAEPWVDFEVPHASINRFTQTTVGPGGDTEGGAFFSTSMRTLSEGDCICIYLRADDPWGERVPEMLTEMAPAGFGRDSSVGAGAYEVVTAEPLDDFGPIDEANGFVSLSTYCPAADDPAQGRWHIRLKRGKLGENAGDGNPFKRPLLQMEPGAVFWTDDPIKPCYGRAVTDIAPGMPEAIQNCYTLAVPCVLPGYPGRAASG